MNITRKELWDTIKTPDLLTVSIEKEKTQIKGTEYIVNKIKQKREVTSSAMNAS